MTEVTALTLTKATSQATPYSWIWTTRSTRTIVTKYIGTTTITFEGANDTEALRKINAHEGLRAAAGRPIHG
jgi:ribosomal protein S13